jgi:hypothetical protein
MAPRTFKIEIDKGEVQKVKAENASDALRSIFKNAGEVRITAIPVPEFAFEVIENGGKTIKGTIKQARKASEGSTEEET